MGRADTDFRGHICYGDFFHIVTLYIFNNLLHFVKTSFIFRHICHIRTGGKEKVEKRKKLAFNGKLEGCWVSFADFIRLVNACGNFMVVFKLRRNAGGQGNHVGKQGKKEVI